MTILNVLSDIFKNHKHLYFAGAILIVLGTGIYFFIAYAKLLALFLILCGFCCFLYGFVDGLKSSNNGIIAFFCRFFKITFLILILIFTVSFAAIQLLIINNAKDEDLYSKYIIVLGCAIDGTEPSDALKCRLDKAAQYMSIYPKSTAVLCGGQGINEITSEAQVMYDYLTYRGIDSSRLIIENNSHDTRQNIIEAKEIINSKESGNIPQVAVVSNGFHLYRAKLIMKKHGFEQITTLKAATPPSFVLILNLHLREYFSVVLEYFNI